MRKWIGLAVSVALLGCTGTPISIEQEVKSEVGSSADVAADIAVVPDGVAPQDVVEETDIVEFDFVSPEDVTQEVEGPQCDPGEGCFLDPCDTNDACQSGWCVQHLGENVCTKTCQQECPPGWTCSQVAGTDPDVVYICVSEYANLCRPCATGENCTSTGGSEDACIDYGDAGNFCGAPCGEGDSCPWGFTCQEVESVAGATLKQCVNDTGECPCTQRSIDLGLATPCTVANDFGACAGQRLCVEGGGLSDCDAPEPAVEICNGLDDDCDGETDEPDLVGGDYVNLCNDDNDCTSDECAGVEGCLNELLDEGACEDGNPCTVADHCEAGACVGSPVECDDNNPCTDDLCTDTGGCDFPPVEGQCDDNDPCTIGDVCQAGVCTGTQVPCQCQEDDDCGELEDGNLCNGTLVCDNEWPPYECRVDPDTVVDCPAPDGMDAPCLAAVCDEATGACSLAPANDGAACDDGNACTFADSCLDGICSGGPAVNCNDGNVCTDDACEPEVGCTYQDNTLPCNDGNVCTTSDLCADGACTGGPTLVCDDDNACNGVESCDEALGCVAGEPLSCDDGNLCNGTEGCQPDLGCVSGAALECDDSNPCTDDSCHPKDGCQHVANTVACDDGNACTSGDVCAEGKCTYLAVVSCDDDNVCTDDSCDPGVGCINQTNTAPCDDGDACTLGDSCLNGQCQSAKVLDCDDGNPCTADSCDSDSGCFHEATDGECDDGNACTVGDHCQDGACIKGGLLNCNDDNVCTNDTCDPETGCVSTLNTAPCDDDNLCTTGDKCHLGECQGTGNLVCDDGNLCTDDSCAPQVGCQFVANTAACDDGNVCTDGDACDAGWCQPGGPLNCDDNNDCTTDTCAEPDGCQYDAVENGSPCLDNGVEKYCVDGECVCIPDCDGKECGPDGCGGTCGSCEDDNACTLDEQCVDGLCTSTPLTCEDNNLCTDDSCDPDSGCVFANNSVDCDDGNPCTANDTCSAGSCSGQSIPALTPFKFTSGGADFRIGPSQNQLDSAYSGTSLQGKVTSDGGIQVWEVPYSGAYTIKAAGAKGGDEAGGGSGVTMPGFGAVVQGDFALEAGTSLKVIVGQKGHQSNQGGWAANGCGGGGGGSFVYVDANDAAPLIVAGGGGGQAEQGKGGHGSSSTAATNSSGGSGTSGAGGTGGKGGAYGPNPHSYTSGAGGGGWSTNGQDSPTIRNPGGKGGRAPRNGAQGGFGTHNSYGAEHCSGGFGGGGAGADNTGAGGGGGGYNGGGGGRNYNGKWGAAGGGGSYNAGANQTASAGANNGIGYVTITFECQQ